MAKQANKCSNDALKKEETAGVAFNDEPEWQRDW